MLNEMCCFWVNTSSKDRKASECSRKTFRSYRISKNDLESSWGGYNLSWGIFLLASRNLELVNAPTNPCYHHIDAACDYSMYCQLSNPFCLCPGQQATTYSASSTGYINLHLTMEGIIHPQMDTTIRTLKLETSKRERPNARCCPSSTGSSKRDLDAPSPKELGLPSLEGGILGSQNRKKESKIVVAKRQRKKKPTKIGKECPRTGVRTSRETNSAAGQPNLHRAGSGRGEKKNNKNQKTKKEEPKLSHRLLSSLFLLGRPALTSWGCIFLCLPNETEL